MQYDCVGLHELWFRVYGLPRLPRVASDVVEETIRTLIPNKEEVRNILDST